LKTVSLKALASLAGRTSLLVQGNPKLESVDIRSLTTYGHFQEISNIPTPAPAVANFDGLKFIVHPALLPDGKGTEAAKVGPAATGGTPSDASSTPFAKTDVPKRTVQASIEPRKSCHTEVYAISLQDSASDVTDFAVKTCNSTV